MATVRVDSCCCVLLWSSELHYTSNVPVLLCAQVVERVVEVEPDKAAMVEQLRQQMKQEMEQHQQQLEGQALEAARQEAEARAKQQLEVRQLLARYVQQLLSQQRHAC